MAKSTRTPPDDDLSMRIRRLNDAFRKTLIGGTLVLTSGIVALGSDKQQRILAAVQAFDTFDGDNDPWHEHDMGAFDIDGDRVFFKIDYYDLTQAMHSDDPADASVTERVMTIMLAWEY